jgi:hypothetical protein
MTLRIPRRNKYVSLLVTFLATLALVMAATSAAGAEEIHNLPGKSWSCGKCATGTVHFEFAQAQEGSNSSLCVGPVTHDGNGWHAPYGWLCHSHEVKWEFNPINNASPAVYNPNSGTFQYIYLLGY